MASPATRSPIDFQRLEDLVLAASRIIAGAMFALHGIQKLFDLWIPGGGVGPPVGSQLWVGGIIELVAGVLICIGLFTRVAAFLASGQMAVAYFQYHWGFHFDARILPVVNDGDAAVLYCFVFLLFAVRGAGAASLDRSIRGTA
jgi:putative oxidoreductase